MKNGTIGEIGSPDTAELELINKFTRRKFGADEVYTFSVVLCDNDVDRDFERFTDDSLNKMAELFVGKTGIFDHSHKSENQCARIFSCRVETDADRKNRIGEPYKRLFARAYMPKSDKTKDLILSIDAGIKKEVSVGCSMQRSVCSVCGGEAGTCSHRKGRHYRSDGKKQLCFYNLCEPTDAYEWSFVAVPAQPCAGVVKAFTGGNNEFLLGNITKSLENGELVLSADEAASLEKSFCELKSLAESAGEFLAAKKADIIKLYLPNAATSAGKLFAEALDRLSPDELFKLYNEGIKSADKAEAQLASCIKAGAAKKNTNFII